MNKIFIGGCDRSGTTYLASLLGGAEGTIVTPESIFKNITFKQNDFTEYLAKDWRFKSWEIGIPEGCSKPEDFINLCVKSYSVRKHIVDPATWVDHSPNNLEFYNEYKQNFCDITFIHIIRNPYDVINSIIPLEWGPNSSLVASLFWLKKVSVGLSIKDRKDVFTINYESLIGDKLESSLSELMNKIGLVYDEEKAINPVNYFLPSYTRSQHKHVGSTNYLSIERKNLRDEDYAIINKVCGSLIKNLGYEVEEKNSSALQNTIWLARSIIVEVIRRFLVNPKRYKAKRNAFYDNKSK